MPTTTSFQCERRMTVNKTVMGPDWIDPDDAPELDDAWFEKADLMFGRTVIRKGRPPGSSKDAISLRLDQAVLDHFRAGGPGWQTRINEALRKVAGLN